MTQIDISTGSRLHFGLICAKHAAPWRFGGIGVMLRQPAWRLSVNSIAAGSDKIEATGNIVERILEFLTRIRSHQNVKPLRITVRQSVAFHTGLGSGTQLGLALSAAIEVLTHRRLQEDPFHLAQLANRAIRSAIGTIGFARGGFLVDHGESHGDSLHRQVDRIAVPDEWRFVLVHPVHSQGLSGEKEQAFFGTRVHMPLALIEGLVQQVLEQIVPAIRHGNFEQFATALENYGQTVGTFYAAEQGGVFAHPVMAQLVARLQANGVSGMAQSSWGPLVAITASSQDHAEEILRLIPNTIDGHQLNISISEPLNAGATIRSEFDDGMRHGFA
jgi:beta-ribofuranosylaminobenzene 5'-phosphate synthase